ncbi:hypothetical protein PRIPAC_94087 [Pristionchus pacificus]|uniref:Uncharacterized protein n=1 Tax=Pristionchus pacificus TaxID=54126 RepID=A0A2A6BB00_PRIPA|nr:hypothetical protein PRIPAC_94087 [Pristionchus pacificus]|eukprot:PDM63036.1 hypothetical protein PRIPAC_50251 [Pristionchus pacificus]
MSQFKKLFQKATGKNDKTVVNVVNDMDDVDQMTVNDQEKSTTEIDEFAGKLLGRDSCRKTAENDDDGFSASQTPAKKNAFYSGLDLLYGISEVKVKNVSEKMNIGKKNKDEITNSKVVYFSSNGRGYVVLPI